ncbi:28662_t:CDS:2 [Dentiscutata erythropus]|uniref:28662_t:CDS:1 n=1 Tax=Dentiscutata erythropus TaxID=1348616 RepID=A0A9N9BVZ2_9GLOM|nr:28662_t:CDS:2 [Dentiscutata erythropus]
MNFISFVRIEEVSEASQCQMDDSGESWTISENNYTIRPNIELCRFLSHRALEEVISIEHSTSLSLEASDCFKVRELEKNWVELTKDRKNFRQEIWYKTHIDISRREEITLLKYLAEHLKHIKRITLDRIALSNTEELSVTKKEIIVQAPMNLSTNASAALSG